MKKRKILAISLSLFMAMAVTEPVLASGSRQMEEIEVSVDEEAEFSEESAGQELSMDVLEAADDLDDFQIIDLMDAGIDAEIIEQSAEGENQDDAESSGIVIEEIIPETGLVLETDSEENSVITEDVESALDVEDMTIPESETELESEENSDAKKEQETETESESEWFDTVIEVEEIAVQQAEYASLEVVSAPDYDIWLCDTIRNGLSANGTSFGTPLYSLYKDMQDPIYKELGGILLDDVPLSFGSTMWYNMLNHDFYDNQKLIYEALIMSYFKYSDEATSSSFNTSQIDRANAWLLKIWGDLADEFAENGIYNFTSDDYLNLSVEDAAKYLSNVSGMKDIVSDVKKSVSKVKDLIKSVVNVRALEDIRQERIQALTYARNACAGMSSTNQDFINACDEIIQYMDIPVVYEYIVKNNTISKTREELMDQVWSKLCEANPVLKTIDRGMGAMDIIFNTSGNSENNLKMELLYTMDCYFQMGLSNASMAYTSNGTSENAAAFTSCFEGYLEFQMYGNSVAKSWISGTVDGGLVNHAFSYVFYRENIQAAEDMKSLCDSQTATRKNMLSLISKYQDIYNGMYMTEEYEETFNCEPASDTKTTAANIESISAGINSTVANIRKVWVEGQCGENVYWKLYEDGGLIIYGEGEMDGYSDGYCILGSYQNDIKTVSIADGVSSIGTYAFNWGTNISSISIPDSVKEIGVHAFQYCSSLESITIPQGVKTIGVDTFLGCSSLRSVTLPDSVTSIEDHAFSDCTSLRSIELPESVNNIGDYAFIGCSSLHDIVIPKDVKSIGSYTFYGCTSLNSVEIPNGLITIGDYAFYNCTSLKSVTIPDSVTEIGQGAFYECSSLNSLVISNGLTTIQSAVFNGCRSLKSVVIPDSVKNVEAQAFGNCDSLVSITIPGSVSSMINEIFGYHNSLLTIYGYNGTEAATYAAKWSIPFKNIDHKHQYSAYTVTKAATCTETGSQTRTCSVCKVDETKEIAATGHTAVTLKAVAATCTKAGKTKGSKCSVCGTVLKEQKTVAATGHKWNSGKVTKAATTTATGIKTYTCTVCKKTKTEKIPKVTKKKNTITASSTTRTYSSKAQTFSLGAMANGNAKLTYKSSSKSVTVSSSGKVTIAKKFTGKATITITAAATDTYQKATKTVTVTVNPAKTALSKVTNSKGAKLTVKWKKDSSVTGYQLQYSTDKNFKTGVKKVDIKKNGTISTVISNLTKGKTYYVRIRTYKTVSKVDYYSEWSNAKQVKISK